MQLINNTKEKENIVESKIGGPHLVKVRKFQNEYMESSHCPKYEQKKLKNSALDFRAEFFNFFVHILGNGTISYIHSEIS